MRSIVSAGEPPADILGNLAVPSGSVVTGRSTSTREPASSTGPWSSVRDSPPTRWPTSTGPSSPGWVGRCIDGGSPATGSTSGTVVLFKKGSGDSFYWEVGATVSPTTSAGTTTFSLELFELPDDN